MRRGDAEVAEEDAENSDKIYTADHADERGSEELIYPRSSALSAVNVSSGAFASAISASPRRILSACRRKVRKAKIRRPKKYFAHYRLPRWFWSFALRQHANF